MVNYDNIPAELKAFNQWCLWRDKDGRKVPCYQRPGYLQLKHAKVNDSSTWMSFFDASECEKITPDCGLGFVFTTDDPFIGIDIDDCLDVNGVASRLLLKLIDNLGGYWEVSPSGTGVKGWIWNKNIVSKTGMRGKWLVYPVEIYDHARYFTVTGNKISDEEFYEQRSCQEGAFLRLRDEIAAQRSKPLPADTSSINDDQWSDLMGTTHTTTLAALAGTGSERSTDVLARAARYVESTEPAVSGEEGHNRTFRLAVALAHGFCLGKLQVFNLLERYSERCQPPWSAKELMHKADEAVKAGPPPGKQRGWLMSAEMPRLTAQWEQDQEDEEEEEYPEVRLYDLVELSSLPMPTPMLNGYLPETGVGFLWGPSSSYKSFVALDVATCIAYGVDFMGVPVRSPGGVVYSYSEGLFQVRGEICALARGVVNRDEGLASLSRPTPLLFDKLPYCNLSDLRSVKAVVRSAQKLTGGDLKLLVIDTFSGHHAGLDEREDREMGLLMRALHQIADDKFLIMIVHHAVKTGAVFRGATSIMAGADFMWQVKGVKGQVGSDGKRQRPQVYLNAGYKQKEMAEPDEWLLPLDQVLPIERPSDLATLALSHKERVLAQLDENGIPQRVGAPAPDGLSDVRRADLGTIYEHFGESWFQNKDVEEVTDWAEATVKRTLRDLIAFGAVDSRKEGRMILKKVSERGVELLQ